MPQVLCQTQQLHSSATTIQIYLPYSTINKLFRFIVFKFNLGSTLGEVSQKKCIITVLFIRELQGDLFCFVPQAWVPSISTIFMDFNGIPVSHVIVNTVRKLCMFIS